MHDEANDLLKKGMEKLLFLPKETTVRVLSHYDTDGVTSAAIICEALYRKGYNFHVTLLKHPFKEELTRVKEEGNEFVILSDMGSGQIEYVKNFGCPSIILDHHQPIYEETVIDSIIQINANLIGFDGNYEACGASMSYLFATTLDRKNKDLAPLAVTGAIGDKQHFGGFKGLNKIIFEEAVSTKKLKIEKSRMKVMGREIIEEITLSVDPYYTSLSGRDAEVEKLLKTLHINPHKKYENLSPHERKILHSALLLKLLKNNIQPEIIDTVVKERYSSETIPDDLDRFSEILDACGKSGETGLALAVCLGDTRGYQKAVEVECSYRRILIKHLNSLEQGGLKETTNIQYFYSPKASLGSVLSSIVMNYFPYKGKPVFSFSKKNGSIHVSCRATRTLVNHGIDLGGVMKKIASHVGGSGGGHKIAAGGTLEKIKDEELVKIIDEEVANQKVVK
ncbi:MAG TPA: DHH family phosphoesterase [Thermoplasmatales archaeon]|nr:DHH family phosphoesterase [Thermoplasmatales archaeon]